MVKVLIFFGLYFKRTKASQASSIFRLCQHFRELGIAIFDVQLMTKIKNIYFNNGTYLWELFALLLQKI